MPDSTTDLLPLAKRFVWRVREDVRKGQTSNLTQLPASFEHWWLMRGRSEYPAWGALNSSQVAELSKPNGSLRVGTVELALPQALRQLLQYRADVVEKFTIDGKLDAHAVVGWFLALGMRQHLMHEVLSNDWVRLLDKPVLPEGKDASSKHSEVPHATVLMNLIWQMLDPSLQQSMPLNTPETRQRFIGWFMAGAVPMFELQPLISSRWRQWLMQELPVNSGSRQVAPRFALVLHDLSSDWAKGFDLSSSKGVTKLNDWAKQAIADGGPWSWLVKPKQLQSPSQNRIETEVTLKKRPFGVNLFGFAYGELGIGEDLRMAVLACESAGIPYRVVNIDAGKDLRQADGALTQHVKRAQSESPYVFNVFCLPGFDMVSRVFLRMGPQVFANHINIGWWPWELPVWPKAWDEAFGLVDELWAGSSYTRSTYAKATNKPVELMPLPATVDRGRAQPRSYFGLPARKFLFLFIFDFNSFLTRKNPHAVVAAFRKAFPATNTSVNLVLKVMNGKESDPRWQSFLKLCAKDDRIWMISETLDRRDVLGLVHACDAYVSLHRAEGFGRTLAEAMLYGKPVVATNFSGNTDFMHPELCFPVDYELVPVKQGEYAFVEPEDEAVWAEPSVVDAARKMKQAYARSKEKGYSASLTAYAKKQFSPARIGELMKARLMSLAKEHELEVPTGANGV